MRQQLAFFKASYCVIIVLYAPNRVSGEEAISAVIYDTPSDVVAGVGPDTSENVAYGVTQTVLTTPNPAYGVVQR